MNNNEQQPDNADEISLLDLFAVLLHRKALIITLTLIAAVGVIVFSILSLKLPSDTSPLPNQYTPKALMLINESSPSGGGMASMISASGLGGLAGLAGVSAGSSFSELAVYLVSTNTFRDTVVDEFKLIERSKGLKKSKSPRADSRKVLGKVLTAEYDDTSGVFSVSFTDIDPDFAQPVVNFCVAYLIN